MHNARIIEPLGYLASDGRQSNIPVGPCLVEEIPGEKVEIIWGTTGQNSTTLAQVEMQSAEQLGLLLLLD